MLSFVLLCLGHKYPVVYINSVAFEFTNERLTYFIKFTILHVKHQANNWSTKKIPSCANLALVYVIKQLESPKMFTNERLFTIQPFTIGRFHCIKGVCECSTSQSLFRKEIQQN